MSRLTDIGQEVEGRNERHRYLCACGTIVIKARRDVASGHIKSCGCLNAELRIARNTKHGGARRGAKDPEYYVWHAMIKRCTVASNRDYPEYGARGISVCERWLSSYAAFIADMGRRPAGNYSIDRIDNAGGYEPGNCRWATASEQAFNRRPKRWYRRPEARS